jgi:hypothetical protein
MHELLIDRTLGREGMRPATNGFSPKPRARIWARSLDQLVRLMSGGQPFDVAVTAAFDNPIVVGEVEALQDDADLALLPRASSDIRASIQDRAPNLNLQQVDSHLGPLTRVPAAGWTRPVTLDKFRPHIRHIREAVEEALPDPPLRYLQCTVHPVATTPTSPKLNTVGGGPNVVTVFVGRR